MAELHIKSGTGYNNATNTVEKRQKNTEHSRNVNIFHEFGNLLQHHTIF